MKGEVVTTMLIMVYSVHYLATELDAYLGIHMVTHHCATTYSFSCS